MEKLQNTTNTKEKAVKYGTAAALIASGAVLFDGAVQTNQPDRWERMDCTTEIKNAINPKAPEIIFHQKLAQLIEKKEFNYQSIKNALGDEVKKDEKGEYISIGIASIEANFLIKYYISYNNHPVGEKQFTEIANKIKIAINEKNSNCTIGGRLI